MISRAYLTLVCCCALTLGCASYSTSDDLIAAIRAPHVELGGPTAQDTFMELERAFTARNHERYIDLLSPALHEESARLKISEIVANAELLKRAEQPSGIDILGGLTNRDLEDRALFVACARLADEQADLLVAAGAAPAEAVFRPTDWSLVAGRGATWSDDTETQFLLLKQRDSVAHVQRVTLHRDNRWWQLASLPKANPSPGFLGIVPGLASNVGLRVGEVLPDSPAARAGLRSGMLITGVEPPERSHPDPMGEWEIRHVLAASHPGDVLRLSYIRGVLKNEREAEIEVTLESLPQTLPRQ